MEQTTQIIEQIAERLTAPGVGKSMGANFNQNLPFYKGLYLAPNAVKNALKTAVFASYMLEKLGFEVIPSKANFIFAKHPDFDGAKVYEELKAKGILVRHFTKNKDKERVEEIFACYHEE